jgi:hypothetical protein
MMSLSIETLVLGASLRSIRGFEIAARLDAAKIAAWSPPASIQRTQ